MSARRPNRVFFPLALILLLGACADNSDQQEPPPPPVVFDTFEATDITVSEEYAGRVRGSREIEVRSRVQGLLMERLYTEGRMVERGEALFVIDPDPYRIAVDQAEAERENAQARFRQAEREWRRISGLYERNAVSELERDEALSQFELAEAGLALANAGVASARLNLDWTRVAAPASGSTGLETVPEGSLISSGALLTTIIQIDPVHVRFALPERDAAMQRAVQRAMADDDGDHRRTASLRLPDGSDYEHPGVVDFTDASIDPRTGSVSARAVFPNPDGHIMPGQFVRLKMDVREIEDAFLLPESAIAQGREGAQVYLVDENDRIAVRPVDLGPVVEGRQVVTSGLEASDRVVVRGLVNLQDGMPVDARPVDGEQ